jgi:hypothetical protein
MQTINIDYDAIIAGAKKGLRRSAVFMGLGVNSADDSSARSYHLVNDTNIRILPDEVAPEVIESWKSEFRQWIVICGFRELVDHLCVFIDRLYKASTLIQKTYELNDYNKFERLGLDAKISKLKSATGISYAHGDALASFYPLRNCLVHRLGIVGDKDVEKSGLLDFSYLRMASIFQPESGGVIDIPDIFAPDSKPFITPEAGTLALRFELRKVSFRKGEVVTLSPRTLTEALFFADLCVISYAKNAIEFANEKGAISK